MKPVLYETHLHTPLCKHAEGLPGDYAAAAESRGLKGIIVTCHSPMPDDFSASVRMSPGQFPEYLDLVAQARQDWAGRVDVRLGLESDYFPGMEGWLTELHQRADFHYILGSVHPQIREYMNRFYKKDWVEFHRGYFGHLADAAESGFFDSLSHPDIVKNQGSEFWDVEALLPWIRPALDRIAQTGIAMELNTSGLNKRIPEMNPGRGILHEIRTRNIPITLGADAHQPERTGDKFVEALELLREEGFSEVNYFLERQRIPVPIDNALASLALVAK